MKKSLSEVFLDELNGDFSDASVGRALQICDRILKEQLAGIKTEEEFVSYFFEQAEEDSIIVNEKGEELFAFWDVFDEFREVLGRLSFLPELSILTTVMEVDYINKSVENLELEKRLSPKHLEIIKEVKAYICGLQHLTSIRFYFINQDGIYGKNVIPVNFPEQEGELYPYECVFLENILLKNTESTTLLEVSYYTDKEVTVKIKYSEFEWKIISERFTMEL